MVLSNKEQSDIGNHPVVFTQSTGLAQEGKGSPLVKHQPIGQMTVGREGTTVAEVKQLAGASHMAGLQFMTAHSLALLFN